MTTFNNEDPADPSVHEPKPAAYVVWAENGNCIMWTTNKAQAEACAKKHQRPMRELYDQDHLADAAAMERERLLANMTRYGWRRASIWKHFYCSATGDYVDLRELRKLLEAPYRAELDSREATTRTQPAGGYQPLGPAGPVQPPPRKP